MDNRPKEEVQSRHWTQRLAEQVISQKKQPFVVTGGMTTSGPAHLGTVCEFLYPAIVKQAIEKLGKSAEMYFVGDILDAFDGIPLEMQKYESVLKPDLGKPLVYTKDPLGCHNSFGEHYLDQAEKLMRKLSLEITVVKANDLYDSGKFDKYASIFLAEEEKVKEVVARTSMRKLEELKDWSPIMPICQKCGKIATTRVTWHNNEEYEYVCDRDVKYTKGCDYKGRAKLTDHKYKLQWRLHWPTWQAVFNSSIEGSGVDHMTVGGSANTAEAIHKEILKREPPILFKYGFILFKGKKYSKSKGIGMSATELSELMPPELLKYILIEPNLEQNKDIDPTGDKLVLLYNEVERISTITKPESKADEKRALAFAIAIKKLPWKASFVDVLLDYQVYRDWEKVGKKLHDEEGVNYLSGYIEKWLAKGYAPERYNFSVHQAKITENKDAVKVLISKLDPGMDELTVHNLVYEVAKDCGINANDLFKSVYNALIGKESGPRLGKLIVAIGIEKVKQMLQYSVS
jgi:lysyl-tRNA synthetase class 1